MSTNAPPVAIADLEPALREIVGEALTPGDTAYAVDGLVPRFVATPASVEELAAVLAATDARSAAVIPWGGGRHMTLGNVPSKYDVALRTVKLDRVLEYEPTDLVVTAEAGITLGRLQALLAEHGQFLPIEAPDDSTVGGVLAAGSSGPSRHAYGLPRDWLLGCRIAHADGAVSKGGGRVVKNVAGYDLPKLAIGSLGTLGVIVEATFKVAPMLAAQETFLATYRSIEAAAELLFAADERGLTLRALALQAGSQDEVLTACWLTGPPAAIERTARELAVLARSDETQRLQGEESERWWSQLSTQSAPAEGGVSLRVSLPPSAVVGFMQRLTALDGKAGPDGPPPDGVLATSLAYPTTGLVLVQLGNAPVERLVDAIETARRQATETAGSLVAEVAPVAVKERIDVWGDAGDSLALMRRLKQQFDPRGTLNPGRFIGGL